MVMSEGEYLKMGLIFIFEFYKIIYGVIGLEVFYEFLFFGFVIFSVDVRLDRLILDFIG